MLRVWFLRVFPLLFLLSACGGEVTAHNQADIDFLQAAQAERTTMTAATLTASTSQTQQIKDVAGAIARSQERYIADSARLLGQWNVAIPAPAPDPQVQALGTSANFESDALTLIVARHQTLLAAANTELTAGQNDAAKNLARDLITARNAEVGQLQALLAGDVKQYGAPGASGDGF